MRRAQLAGEKPLGPWLEGKGLALDASRLQFAGRWLTPPFSPARFDNRFFLLEWRPEDGEPRVAPPESEEGEWITPRAALARLDEGRALAAPPIVHLLKVLAEERPEAAAPRLRDTAEANLGPLRRIELRAGIVLLPLAAATLPPAAHTNAYLLGTGGVRPRRSGLAFRSGERASARGVGGRRRAARPQGAGDLAHPSPPGPCRRRRGRAPGARGPGLRAIRAAPSACGRGASRSTAGSTTGNAWRSTGRRRSLLRVHHTPGHTGGHLCFEVEATGDLIAGDMVAGFGTIVIDPPEGDMDLYLASLDRLRELAPRTLFVSHGAPFLDSVTKLTEYRDHRLAREAQILACWEAGVREPREMIPRLYPEIAPAVVPLAERQILAHLVRLERLGRIGRLGV